jgi:hypothetical protein
MMQIPTIYKYRDWTNPQHVDILNSKRIYLPSPEELNDPFDCRIPISLELLDTDAKILKYFNNYIVENLRSLQERKVNINKYTQDMVDAFKSKKTEMIKQYSELYTKRGNLHFGIFCASIIWDSIQMWSYYSKNHTGFCIGFNPERLFPYIPSFRAMKVVYRKDFPKVNPLATYSSNYESSEFIDNCFKMSHTKAIGWKYEKEYRIFSNKFPAGYTKNNRLIAIDNKCFRNLLVGLNFPENELPKMKELAYNLKIPLYKIIRIPDKFKFGKTRIN